MTMIKCAVCECSNPQPVDEDVANAFQFFVCPQCDVKRIPKEDYEIRKVEINILGEWKGVNVEIPTLEEFEIVERFKRRRMELRFALTHDEDEEDDDDEDEDPVR